MNSREINHAFHYGGVRIRLHRPPRNNIDYIVWSWCPRIKCLNAGACVQRLGLIDANCLKHKPHDAVWKYMAKIKKQFADTSNQWLEEWPVYPMHLHQTSGATWGRLRNENVKGRAVVNCGPLKLNGTNTLMQCAQRAAKLIVNHILL